MGLIGICATRMVMLLPSCMSTSISPADVPTGTVTLPDSELLVGPAARAMGSLFASPLARVVALDDT